MKEKSEKPDSVVTDIRDFLFKSTVGRSVLALFLILCIALLAIPTLEEYGYQLNLNAGSDGASRVEIKPKEKEKIDPNSASAPSQSDSSSPSFISSESQFNQYYDYGCPYDPRAFMIGYPSWWFGPINGWWIMVVDSYLGGGFAVTDPSYYQYTFPDPYSQITRNQWIPLAQMPFEVCVDNANYVYAKHS